MAIFLGIPAIDTVVEKLRLGGYSEDTPVAVVYKASWREEKIVKGTLSDIAEKVRKAGIKSTALILVGEVLDPKSYGYSKLYDAGFTHSFRKGKKMFEKGVAIVYVSGKAAETALKVRDALAKANIKTSVFAPKKYGREGTFAIRGDFREFIREIFSRFDAIVAVMASGIIIRAVGPLLKSKFSDPAIVCVDVAGRFAVALVSGHYRGANHLARLIADGINATAVVTTASDALGKKVLKSLPEAYIVK
jgi:cobalt-precorrin 5A hydrolase/precorrin-3B C17-methyltransferase